MQGTWVRALVWKIPHAAEQLGPCATNTEPARLEPVLGNKRGRDSERPGHDDEEWPPLTATREGPRTETKTQHGQKKKSPPLKAVREFGSFEPGLPVLLGACSKHCAFLHHNPGSVDWLFCAQANQPKFGSVTIEVKEISNN